jgi:hypothetical protein
MRTPAHDPVSSFPYEYPNAGNGKRGGQLGNRNGNQLETNGNNLPFSETRWKRELGFVETRGQKNTQKSDPSVSTLDLARLEKLRRLTNGDVISACPACRESGRDRKGDNLRVFSSGAFHCISFQNDKEHNSRIFALVGIKSECVHDPENDREWRQCRTKERLEQQRLEAIAKKARECREALASRYAWTLADVCENSPQRIDCDLVESNPRHFLASLFTPDASVWTGEVFQSGTSHASRWRTCRQWSEASPSEIIGPMVTPATWKAGTVSRTAANVATAPFTVLDFDGYDGLSPTTPREIEKHLAASLAVIRWLREPMQWQLAAILHTGNKSLHAWFHTPPPEVLSSLKPAASSLGMDAGLIGRPEHPCRLPGHLHAKSGKPSRVLWLQEAA